MPDQEDACPANRNIYKLCRELKKEEHSLFNCLSSIVDDAAFCSEIRVLYADLPLLANLRCGLWYTPRPDGTCYFKSTDGHQGHHQFSSTRLNWHVAEIAARNNGVIIVDATRKGKRMPDALSKTVPIWAAVINRAVARVRLHDAQKEQRRLFYSSHDGEVLTPVADTQTSISVRSDEPDTANSTSVATAEVKAAASSNDQPPPQQTPGTQLQPLQAAQAGFPCSTSLQVEELLLDCMGDSCMELLSGVSINNLRPNTPDQVYAQQPHSSPHSTGAAAAAALAAAAGGAAAAKLARSLGCIGMQGSSPIGRVSSLQRSMSLHISPQPSLQEWLDEADVLHRLSAALHYHDCWRSPVRRARMSCHSITGGGSSSFSIGAAAAIEEQPVLYASSAPATSCLQCSSPPKCMRALYQDTSTAVQDEQRMRQQQQQQDDVCELAWLAEDTAEVAEAVAPRRHPEPAGFTLIGGDAADPVTPRLGCCGALLATFSSIEEALQDEQPAAAWNSGCIAQRLPLLQQQQPHWGLPIAPPGPPTVGSAVSVTAGDIGCDATADAACDFAFPSPPLLAQSAGSPGLADATVGSVSAGAGPGSTSSSSGGAGLALPEMPVVVLNGTSHQPGDAASILHIWRSTDLEDVATLPGISDFKPGVFHVPEQLQEGDEEPEDCYCRQGQQQGSTGCDTAAVEDVCSDGWVLVNGQQHRTEVAAAAAGSVPTSAEGHSAWMDEETGVGYDGLCAFAPPPIAMSLAASDDVASSACSVGSAGCLRPSSPSASSSCSADSGLSNISGNSKRSATAAHAACCAAAAAAEQLWDTELHLPLWVPSNERQAIEAKLDGWVERLLEVGADVRGLAAQLRKPLRPLWVTQDSLIWTNQVAHPSTLSFTPLLLVSASQPRQCERQAARAFGSPNATGRTASGSLVDLDDLFDVEDDFASPSSSKTTTAKVCRSHSRSGNGAVPRHNHDLQHAQQMGSWSYVYVPGAGDDEESWAGGLSPGLFWDNCAALLSRGPAGIAAAVKQLLAHHRSVAYTTGLGAGSRGVLGWQQQQLGRLCSSLPARMCSLPTQQHSLLEDKHHPAPKGCEGLASEAAAMGFKVVRAAPGIYWLGNTGMALGNLEGATAADVWRTVDAVLCCGTSLSPALQHEYQAMQLSQCNTPPVHCSQLGACGTTCGSAPTQSLPAAAAAVQDGVAGPAAGLCFKPSYSWLGSSHVLAPSSSSYSGTCSNWAAQQQHQEQQHVPECADVSNAAAAASQDSLQISKLNVSVAPALQAKRKGGMLSELLSKSKHQPQHKTAPTMRHVRTESNDSTSSTGSDGSTSLSGSHCSSSYYSTCSDEACAGPLSLPRLKWLPVECAKKDKFSLKQHLQEALEFVSAHLAAGHLVLLHDVEGHDNCVSVAVAMLLACFTSMEPGTTGAKSSGAAATGTEPRFLVAWPAETKQQGVGQQQLHHQQQLQAYLPPALVSKQSVRQRLSLVSSCYPAARPTRGSLKQVYNFFEERRRATAGLARHREGSMETCTR